MPPLPFLFTKSETRATASAAVTAIKQHPLAFFQKQFKSARFRLKALEPAQHCTRLSGGQHGNTPA